MKPIIEVRHISKKYLIGAQQKRYLSLRDQIVGGLQQMFKVKNNNRPEFFALDDITFDVYPGETLGIIGRNGAGKSTLLKVLSRITPPTIGHIKLRGRIASLLEVGTGFHPELTGRENIYLNGAILGMRREEINRKFDEIIDFSGVELFLDTPLKHYSSGMRLRLAFAVAAHLEPEILLIDEVLAVGDVEFQKKCFDKLDKVRDSGRTVIYVSHDLNLITKLCKRGIFLDKGKIRFMSDVGNTVKHYLQDLAINSREEYIIKTDNFHITGASVNKGKIIKYGEDLLLTFELQTALGRENSKRIFADLAIENESRTTVLHLRMPYVHTHGLSFSNGVQVLTCYIKTPNLIPGTYYCTLYLYDLGGKVRLWIERSNPFVINLDENSIWKKNSFEDLRTNYLPKFSIEINPYIHAD